MSPRPVSCRVTALVPPGAIKVEATWNLGVRAGDFIFVAGMQGVDPPGHPQCPADRAIGGSEPRRLRAVTIHVSDLARTLPLVDEIQAGLWGGSPFPPRTMVEARRLFDDDIVEIDSVFSAPTKAK